MFHFVSTFLFVTILPFVCNAALLPDGSAPADQRLATSGGPVNATNQGTVMPFGQYNEKVITSASRSIYSKILERPERLGTLVAGSDLIKYSDFWRQAQPMAEAVDDAMFKIIGSYPEKNLALLQGVASLTSLAHNRNNKGLKEFANVVLHRFNVAQRYLKSRGLCALELTNLSSPQLSLF